MRTIPVTFNHDHTRVIGHFQVDENVSDEEIANCSISWYTDVRDKSLLGLTLIPKIAMPDLIQNVPGLESHSEFAEPPGQHPLHDVVENAEMDFNMRQLGTKPKE